MMAAAPIIGSELVKAIVPTGGGVEERAEAKQQWSNALSLGQAESQIDNVYYPLMRGQIEGLHQRYLQSGQDDFYDFLTPNAIKNLGLSEEAGMTEGPSDASTALTPSGVPAGSTLTGTTPDGKYNIWTDPEGNKWRVE
jgi:hypothetical protein